MAPKKKIKFITQDIKSAFAKACSTSSSNPDAHCNVAAGQGEQEEPTEQDDVQIEVPVHEQDTENEDRGLNEEEVHVHDLVADQGEGDFFEEWNSDHIEADPGIRIPIDKFHPNIRDQVRLAYVAKGPTQPVGHVYPRDHFQRTFCEAWYTKHTWLEYSVGKDAAYCFYCFIFRQDPIDEKFGHTTFTKDGFTTWKNAYKAFPLHVGGPNSMHNQARTAYEDYKNPSSSVTHKVTTYTKESLVKYETRLETSLGIVSYDETYGLLSWDWCTARNPSFIKRINSLQSPYQGPGLPNSKKPYNVIFHLLTGLCVLVKSDNSVKLGPCDESNAWNYTSTSELVLKHTGRCLEAKSVGDIAKLGAGCSKSCSKWQLISNSSMHVSTELTKNGTRVCLDAGPDGAITTNKCKCLSEDPSCDPESQWFKVILSSRGILGEASIPQLPSLGPWPATSSSSW